MHRRATNATITSVGLWICIRFAETCCLYISYVPSLADQINTYQHLYPNHIRRPHFCCCDIENLFINASRINERYKASVEDLVLLSVVDIFSITSLTVSFNAASAISLACSATLRISSNISLILTLIDSL